MISQAYLVKCLAFTVHHYTDRLFMIVFPLLRDVAKTLFNYVNFLDLSEIYKACCLEFMYRDTSLYNCNLQNPLNYSSCLFITVFLQHKSNISELSTKCIATFRWFQTGVQTHLSETCNTSRI